jgi:hypothetical protein
VIDAVTWKSLTLTPGVRVEFWHATGVNKANDTEDGGSQRVVLPGIGAYYSIIDGLGVLAGVYRGFSPPPPPLPSEDTGAAQEQPGLQDPELSINYEFGARYASAPARLELIGFYNDYSNLTDICTSRRLPRPVARPRRCRARQDLRARSLRRAQTALERGGSRSGRSVHPDVRGVLDRSTRAIDGQRPSRRRAAVRTAPPAERQAGVEKTTEAARALSYVAACAKGGQRTHRRSARHRRANRRRRRTIRSEPLDLYQTSEI